MKSEQEIDFSRVTEKVFVDIPSSTPAHQIDLKRVGMRQRPIRMALQNPFTGQSEQFLGHLSIACNLPGRQRGLHMSRFEEALDEFRSASCAPRAFVSQLAELVAATQGQDDVEIEFSAQLEHRCTKNVSGKASMELLTLHSSAHRSAAGTTTAIGLTVSFVNACPCTQRWAMRDFYRTLRERGYDEGTAKSLTLCAPFQAHTNRGTACVKMTEPSVDYSDLYGVFDRAVPIVRELLKGCDEHQIVSKTHRDGQFCEDNLRAIMVELVNTFGERVAESCPVDIAVEVDESVHFHNLWCEVNDTYGNIRSLVQAARGLA